MLLTIMEKIEEWIEPIDSWLGANHDNPLLWVGLVLAGIAIFFLTYSALNKNV